VVLDDDVVLADQVTRTLFVPDFTVVGEHHIRETSPVAVVTARWPADRVAVTLAPERISVTSLAATVRRSG